MSVQRAGEKPAAKKKPPRKPPAGRYEPIRTRRIFEEIVERIRSQIISGELQIGDRLPPERELAELFGVSRTAVREAVRHLEMFGLVDLRKGSHGGAFVRESGIGVVSQSFRDMVDFGRASLTTFLDAQTMICEAAIRAAGARGAAVDFLSLIPEVEVIEALTEQGLAAERALHVLDFYNKIARIADNGVLSAIVFALTEVMRSYNKATEPTPYLPIASGYREILHALADGRPEDAVTRYRAIAEGAKHHMLHLLDSFGQPKSAI